MVQQNTNIEHKTKEIKSSQGAANSAGRREEEKPGAYFFGLVSLIVMALVGLWLSFEIMDLSEAAWGFSGLFSFGVTFLWARFGWRRVLRAYCLREKCHLGIGQT